MISYIRKQPTRTLLSIISSSMLAMNMLLATAFASAPVETITKVDNQINSYSKSTVLTPKNPSVKQFIDKMVKEHSFERAQMDKIFNRATYQPKIISLMERPAEKRLTWGEYRTIFMKPQTIKNGVEFWKQHHQALASAEKVYGVPPAIIIGILGAETRFGRITGGYKAIDALATLGFTYPPRETFFQKELVNLFLLSKREKVDPLTLTGSYAGALGMPQFMPSSYLAYAVDFNKDGRADIWNSATDAIGSIANYLAKHNWQRGEKIVTGAKPIGPEYQSILSKSSLPRMTLTEARKSGMDSVEYLRPQTKVRPLELDGKKGPEYFLTTQNFYAITRYNRSDLYAMAVFELGTTIEKSYLASTNNQP